MKNLSVCLHCKSADNFFNIQIFYKKFPIKSLSTTASVYYSIFYWAIKTDEITLIYTHDFSLFKTISATAGSFSTELIPNVFKAFNVNKAQA